MDRTDTDADNDNDELSFITLSAATKNVTRWLEDAEKQHDDGQRDTTRSSNDQKNGSPDSEYVAQRLKELRAFERRVAGKKD